MSKSKGTNESKSKNVDLFPPTLIGKRLKEPEDDEIITDSSRIYLEKYLDTHEPDYLIQAFLENDNWLFRTKGRYLQIRNSFKNKTTNLEIEEAQLIWETIYYWQKIFNIGDSEEVKMAKRYLTKISPILLPLRRENIIHKGNDLLVHVTPKIKNEHPYTGYRSFREFLDRWDEIYNVFNTTKSKKRYDMKNDAELIKKDALSAITSLGGELYEDEVDLLDLTNTRMKTASYIRLVHIHNCEICRKKELSVTTILRIYRKAMGESKKLQKEKEKFELELKAYQEELNSNQNDPSEGQS